MKIGVVGLGYWGKIVTNNLIELGYDDIILCDEDEVLDSVSLGKKFKRQSNYKKLNCDKIFVLVPTAQHYEVCKYFLKKGKDVFCEKVLVPEVEQSKELYDLADKNNCNLFVDWIFTFNSEVNSIKRIYDTGYLGKLKHACMTRQNFGPARYDVDARLDLASHDVSILLHIFGGTLKSANWKNYKRSKQSEQNDSTLGFLEFDSYTAVINASWEYTKKDRKCFFDFENGFIEWDDSRKDLMVESEYGIVLAKEKTRSPLHESILSFLKNKDFDYSAQKKLTNETIGALNAG